MASQQNPPPDGPGGRRRRPPTTIDLPATEIASESAAPAKDNAAGGTPPPREPPGGPQPAGTPREPSGERRFMAWLPEELSWSQIGNVGAGAVGGIMVLVLFWLLGAFSSERDPMNELNPRLAAIERQLREIAARPVAPSVEPQEFEALASRIGRLEAAQAAPRAPVTDPVVLGRLGATEGAVKSASDNVAALARRIDEVGTTLRDINRRIDVLSASLGELQDTARAAAVGSDRAVRLALAASGLRAAVESGKPFAVELAIARPLTTNAAALAPLEPFAGSGVPGAAELGRELVAILRPMLRATGTPPREGGVLDRLWANIERLVSIRPIDEARGDDRGAILVRVEARAARGQIDGALEELLKLPPDARMPAEAWIGKARARDQAIEASRRFAADAMAALKPAP